MRPALVAVREPADVPVATTAETHISIRKVTKTYQTKSGPVESLLPIDLELRRGEFLAIVGPSGCGKSTLLKLVAGLIPATDGEILIDGTNAFGRSVDIAEALCRSVPPGGICVSEEVHGHIRGKIKRPFSYAGTADGVAIYQDGAGVPPELETSVSGGGST